MSDEKPSTRNRRWLQVARWTVSIAAVVAFGVSALGGFFEVCDETALAIGNEARVVTTCEPASLSDPRYVVFLLVGLLVVVPELSEVTVGSVTLKRRLEAAEQAQGRLQGEVESLRQQFFLQANQSVHVPVYVNPSDPAYEQVLTNAGAPVESTDLDSSLTPAEMQVELIRLAERLRLFDRRLTRLPSSERALTSGPDRDALESWASHVALAWPDAAGLGIALVAEQAHAFTELFAEPLDVVRAVRNAVAHGKSVDERALEEALLLAYALETWLAGKLVEHQRRLEEFEKDGAKGLGPRVPKPDLPA